MASSPSSKAVESDMEQVRADLAQLREDMAAVAESVVALGRGRVRRARDRATEAKDEGLDRLRDLLVDLRERGEAVEGRVESEIQDRPWTSVLAAFGLGFVLGKLMDRS